MPGDIDTGMLATSKRTAAFVRDARSVLRKIDALATAARAADDPALPLITELRSGAERLVATLVHRQQTEQRKLRDEIRRGH